MSYMLRNAVSEILTHKSDDRQPPCSYGNAFRQKKEGPCATYHLGVQIDTEFSGPGSDGSLEKH